MSKFSSTAAASRFYLICRRAVMICFIGITLASCDGGLFGTGDGSNDIDSVATGTDSAVIVETPDATESAGGGTGPVDGGEPVEAVTDSDSDAAPAPETANNTSSQLAISVSFSNTTPSGATANGTTLPAAKLINLTNVDLLLSAEDVGQSESAVIVSPGNTSNSVRLNTGESTLSITGNSAQSSTFEFTVDPLNAVADSVTTVVIAGNDVSDSNNQLAQPVSFAVLDTRVVASAGMAEIRAIDLSSASNSGTAPVYTLTGTDSSGNTGLVFTFPDTDAQAPAAYSLINPGTYLLESSEDSSLAQKLEIAADSVYSVIISDDEQTPVYLEIDSLTLVP